MSTDESKQNRDMIGWTPSMRPGAPSMRPGTPVNISVKSVFDNLNQGQQGPINVDDGRYNSWQWFFHRAVQGEFLHAKTYAQFNDLWIVGWYPKELFMLATVLVPILFGAIALLIMRIM